MKRHRVTVYEGNGIGPEVVRSGLAVMEATGLNFEWEFQDLTSGADGLIPKAAIASFRRNGLAIKGPTATPKNKGHNSLNVQLRVLFDLYQNFRPILSVPGKRTRFSNVNINIAIFRENSEGEYTDKGFSTKNMAVGISVFTKKGCERIARAAFEYARQHGRKKVTIVHKANIQKRRNGDRYPGTQELLLLSAQRVAKDYPEIKCEDLIVDSCCMQLVMWPESFDVIVCSNLIGDILSDLCAGLIGGLGFAPGFNLGSLYAMAEATHGTADAIAGKNIANPTSLILSCAILLDYMGYPKYAELVRRAVFKVIKAGEYVTRDVRKRGAVGTKEFTDAVVREVRKSRLRVIQGGKSSSSVRHTKLPARRAA